MEAETILRAIENGKLNDAREGIDEVLLNKIADSLEEKRRGLGDALVGVCEGCDEQIDEEDTKYQKFFRKALEKFGVDSPADFKTEEEKKKFFDYVDKNYEAENEEDEESEVDEVEEGNQFSKALRAARKEGKATFTVDGKEYTVEDYDDEEVEEGKRLRKVGRAIKKGAKLAGRAAVAAATGVDPGAKRGSYTIRYDA